MTSVEQALTLIRGLRRQGETEELTLLQAHGRAAARSYYLPLDFPLFDNSAMDGYAVGSPSGPWEIVGEVAAGKTDPVRLGPCQAMRIFTGAPIPERTYGVIPQEEATVHQAVLMGKVRERGHIRLKAEEAVAGSCILSPGEFLYPPQLAALAASGYATVEVEKIPTVSLISTGDEIVSPGETLEFGQIYNSNATAVETFIDLWGGRAEPQHIADCPEALRGAILTASSKSDLLITTGGISVGAYDHVRASIESAGYEVKFHGVAVKPGKPIAFGVRKDGKVWFGLPGNPLSTWVGLFVFVTAWLGRELPREHKMLAYEYNRKPGREEFCPARLTAEGTAEILQAIGSHANLALLNADGFVRLSAELGQVRSGEIAEYLPFPWRRAS